MSAQHQSQVRPFVSPRVTSLTHMNRHDEGIDSEHKPVVGPEGHEQTSLALYRHSMRAARLISQRRYDYSLTYDATIVC